MIYQLTQIWFIVYLKEYSILMRPNFHSKAQSAPSLSKKSSFSMDPSISEIVSSIANDADRVLVWKSQCRRLSERVVRLYSDGCDIRLVKVLLEVQMLLKQLHNKTSIFEKWMKCDAVSVANLHHKLDHYFPDSIVTPYDIDFDESELNAFVLSYIQEYSALKLNESRILNDEMKDNLDFVCYGQKGCIQLREFSLTGYHILDNRKGILGSGAFGVVRKGTFRGIDVAVKKAKEVSDDEEYQIYCSELLKEARILQVHSFPGVIRMFGVNNRERPTEMMMELAVCSLYNALHDTKWEMNFLDAEKIELLLSMCGTLSFLHSIGIIHRDIKSGNFLVMNDGSVKVADFGSAETNVVGQTSSNALKGTIPYMAPELLKQVNPPYNYCKATDVYAFGILMNEVMTGKIPYEGDSEENILSSLIGSINKRPTPYDLQSNIASLIADAWHEDPCSRKDFFELCFHLRDCRSYKVTPPNDEDQLAVFVERHFLASDTAGYYTGYMVNNMKHGFGLLQCMNGLDYYGEWENNQLNGKAVRKGLNHLYEGDFVNFRREGFGVMNADGHVYDGEWKNNLREGHGSMKYADGSVYNGKWKSSKRNGHGIMKSSNGSYVGSWKNDVREGHGVMRYTNGSEYDGQWINDSMTGFGKMNFKDGSVYIGEWKNGLMDGDGVMEWNGCKYIGKWRNNVKEGQGVMKSKDLLYDGEWSNDAMHGKGSMIYHSKCCEYIGNWKSGVKEGSGVMKYKDKEYKGEWKNDQKTGYGTMKFADNSEYTGEWADDSMRFGLMKYSDGRTYEGEWKKGAREGRGTMKQLDGSEYSGEWRNDLRNGKGVVKSAEGTYSGVWKDGCNVAEPKEKDSGCRIG